MMDLESALQWVLVVAGGIAIGGYATSRFLAAVVWEFNASPVGRAIAKFGAKAPSNFWDVAGSVAEGIFGGNKGKEQ